MDKRPNLSLQVTRKSFLKAAAAVPAAVLSSKLGHTQANSGMRKKPQARSSDTTFGNAQFQLTLSPVDGLKAKLTHLASGLLLAEGDYSYSFGMPSFDRISTSQDGNTTTATLEGLTPERIHVKHEFRIPTDLPWIEEQISISNSGAIPLALPHAHCGFVLPLRPQAGTIPGALKEFKFTAIPYRREPTGDRQQYADYTIAQVLFEERRSRLRSDIPVSRRGNIVTPMTYSMGFQHLSYPEYASEGWALSDGSVGILITKYSQQGMEWALLDRVPLNDDRVGLRWGGFGIFQGDPELGARLRPKESHRFGVTRITAFQGGIPEAFYTFRAEMEARGHGCPVGFNPPVHWNELYDNKLWWLGGAETDKPENRKKYYTLADMKEEAAKARNIGCEALYLDPGWDTSFASKIWDESRLGEVKDFVEMLRQDYGLSLSLHTPLSGWCNPTSYPRHTDRMSRAGSRMELSLCGTSRQYVEETFARLEVLARHGAAYFMFDGTMFNGECWDSGHGHRVPSTREEHVQSTNRLARMIHAEYPKVLIEMHDQMLGGTHLRYVPTYYGHGIGPSGFANSGAAGFDTVWAFELMWDPMTDLVGGHSIALYYYNLAYSLPLYIHIDLRKDNAQALMFWWNASTCRHLGIGGTHSEVAVRKAHQEGMASYRRLKPFFAAGIFYGIDELTHVHRHPTEQAAVLNCFNLEGHPITREIVFEPGRFGLDGKRSYKVERTSFRQSDNRYIFGVTVPSYGHILTEVRSTT